MRRAIHIATVRLICFTSILWRPFPGSRGILEKKQRSSRSNGSIYAYSSDGGLGRTYFTLQIKVSPSTMKMVAWTVCLKVGEAERASQDFILRGIVHNWEASTRKSFYHFTATLFNK